jgi:proton-dependent oligopeptide transporter, POT family
VLALGDAFYDVNQKAMCLYVGLALIAFGSGGIKPCVSAFLGDQFLPHQRKALTWAYSAFYWCINLGSFLALCLMPAIKRNCGYGWAFGVPGLAMALAAVVFWLGRSQYRHAPLHKNPGDKKMALIFASIIACLIAGQIHYPWAALHYLPDVTSVILLGGWTAFGIWGCFQLRNPSTADAPSIGRVMAIFFFVPVFWALFDQTFSTWITQGEKMVPYTLSIGSWQWIIGGEEMNAANALMVMAIIPIVMPLCVKLGHYASPLRRMTAGMMLAGFSYVLVAAIQTRIDAGEHLSILHQLWPYLVLTTAEVLVSTTGLEFAFTQAPAHLKSVITGMWQFCVAVGNILVVFVTKQGQNDAGDAAVSPGRFMLYAYMTIGVSICFAIIAAYYKYRPVEPDPEAGVVVGHG